MTPVSVLGYYVLYNFTIITDSLTFKQQFNAVAGWGGAVIFNYYNLGYLIYNNVLIYKMVICFVMCKILIS